MRQKLVWFALVALLAVAAGAASAQTVLPPTATGVVATIPATQQFVTPPVTVALAQPMVWPATQCSVCTAGPVIVHPQIPVTVQPCPTIYPVPCVTGCAAPCPAPNPFACRASGCAVPYNVASLSTVEWPITE